MLATPFPKTIPVAPNLSDNKFVTALQQKSAFFKFGRNAEEGALFMALLQLGRLRTLGWVKRG